MCAAPTPSNEAERLAALKSYEVLDTTCEAAFDNIAQMAAQMTGCPISLVSLIDGERQWFKSKIGIETAQTPRDFAFCAHAIANPDETLIVPDALEDSRFADNPLVQNGPAIRFYAGVPLVNPQGVALGTLCVIDQQPRELSPLQQQTLERLAESVMTTLELRRAMITVRKMALVDSLTGIANRAALMAALEQAVARLDRHGIPFLLLYLDLNGFKTVNDRLGHAAGDEVLRVTASALTDCLRTGDVAGRVGGDEFAMLMAGGEADLEGTKQRVRAQIQLGMAAHGWEVGAAIGAIAFTEPSISSDLALAAADRLMYADKTAQRRAASFSMTQSVPAV
jgi:diguanylate cyclase (GGDEF)-like protein